MSDSVRCGAKHPKKNREICTRDAGHVGMHSNGGNVTWKKSPEDSMCTESMAGIRCTLAKGHQGDHFGEGGKWSRDRISAQFDCEPPERDERESDPAIEVVNEPEDQDADELDDTDMRTLARQQREAREAHAAEVDAAPSSALKVHPAADALPLIEGPEFDALVDDIRANGQRHAIVIDHTGEWLVDGRNRRRACLQLGMSPRCERLPEGTNLAAYVISTNLKRRHLNESQRAMIASAIANLGQGQRQTRPGGGSEGVTQAEAAVGAGVGQRTVQRANAVRDKGVPELIDAVVKGKVDLKGAEQVAKLSPNQQRDLIKERVDTSKGPVRGGKLAALSRQETKRETVRNINSGKVRPMPIGQFGVIYVDYPWFYDNSDQHEGSRGHMGYPGMKMPAILAHAAEASKRAGKDCILALWVTNAYIHEIGNVIRAYGAEQHTMWTWPKQRAGVGSWSRGQTEHLVIASIGAPVHTLNELSTLLPTYELREHSRKPAEVAELLQKHCAGPFLELFAQEDEGERPGWTLWGAEVGKFESEAA